MPDNTPSWNNKFFKLQGIASPAFDPVFNELTPRQELLTANASSTRRLQGALMVPLELLVPNLRQVRRNFNPETLQELAEDIKERGILQPLLVRMNGANQFEIIAGERRFRAAQLAELKEVPVIVKEMEDQQAEMAMLVENLQREDLNPLDEKSFFQELENKYNLTTKQIGALIHKSPSYVQKRMALKGSRINLAPGPEKETGNRNRDSEENNEEISSISLSQTSQSFSSRPSKTSTTSGSGTNSFSFKKVIALFDRTLDSISGHEVNEQARNQLILELEKMEQKLMELKQKLSVEK